MDSAAVFSAKDLTLFKPEGTQDASSSTFSGRVFKKFQCCTKLAANITSYSELFHPAAKGVMAVVIGLSPWVQLTKLDVSAFDTDRLLDGFRFPFAGVKELLNLKIYHDLARGYLTSAASGIAFLVSDIGASIHLLGHFGIVNIAAITSAIGKITVFGRHLPAIVGKAVVGTVSMQIQTIAHLLLAIHTASQIAKGDIDKRDKHLRTLAASVMEVAYRSFIIFGASALTTPPGLVVAGLLGVAANGLGIYATYKKLESQEWKQKEATLAVVPQKIKTA